MDKQSIAILFDGDKVVAKHFVNGEETTKEMWNFDGECDFFYCCAYLIDEMARSAEENKRGFNGRAVCYNNFLRPDFTVGKVYNWENGRTASDALTVFPEKIVTNKDAVCGCIGSEGAKFVILREE